MTDGEALCLEMSGQMGDGELLLRAVIASPDEDTPRLVYADWLQENGQDERAEFIRVQCELSQPSELIGREYALKRREWEILGRDWSNADTWFCGDIFKLSNISDGPQLHVRPADAPENAAREMRLHTARGFAHYAARDMRLHTARGFVHSVTCNAADWLKHADAILSKHPVREVTLTGEGDYLSAEDSAEVFRRWEKKFEQSAVGRLLSQCVSELWPSVKVIWPSGYASGPGEPRA
jgi:uncharacterized protein (TIGR02996 family)